MNINVESEDQRNITYSEKLANLIRVETVSSYEKNEVEKFRKFHSVLKDMFPNLFQQAEIEDFDGSLLMKWKGTDSAKKPVLLMSHHDVVEASGEWKYPPFSGEIVEGKVWGRGALDTKCSLWAIMEAAEELIANGYTPKADIYIESACTEEVQGTGADTISKELKNRGIEFDFTLDEGGMILYDPIGGADGTFAVVGVGEKGCADLKFVAHSDGGHASTPGKDTPLVRLGKFMADVENSNIFEVKMNDVTAEMFRRIGPYMKGGLKFLFKNINAFKPLMCKLMPKVSSSAEAMLKTTIAFTMANGSQGTNVLPQEAWVIGNMRFSHHQGRKKSIDAVRKLADKYQLETVVLDPGFESPLSDFETDQFELVEKAIDEVFDDVVTIPYVMMAASDSKYFGRVCNNCFRFAPFFISDEQLSSIHGINENIDVSTLAKAVDFYKFIIKEV